MIELQANGNNLIKTTHERITSGSVNVNDIHINFCDKWAGLDRIVSFETEEVKAPPILLDDSNECSIPPEVLTKHGVNLKVGVVGKRGNEVILPTIYADLGVIMRGTEIPEDGQIPVSLERLRLELAKKGDRLDYTEDGELGLYSGDKLLSAVPVAGGEGVEPVPGPPGPPGPKGDPGDTPYIGENGNWWIGDTDTGYPASGGGEAFRLGHGLKKVGDTISVDMASDENPDKTLPISAAAVDATVGNIEILLKIIRGV